MIVLTLSISTALSVALTVWWAVGIARDAVSGVAHLLLGTLSAAFGLVLLGVVSVTLTLLHRARITAMRELQNDGLAVRATPSLLTPTRFRAWLNEEDLALERVREVLLNAH